MLSIITKIHAYWITLVFLFGINLTSKAVLLPDTNQTSRIGKYFHEPDEIKKIYGYYYFKIKHSRPIWTKHQNELMVAAKRPRNIYVEVGNTAKLTSYVLGVDFGSIFSQSNIQLKSTHLFFALKFTPSRITYLAPDWLDIFGMVGVTGFHARMIDASRIPPPPPPGAPEPPPIPPRTDSWTDFGMLFSAGATVTWKNFGISPQLWYFWGRTNFIAGPIGRQPFMAGFLQLTLGISYKFNLGIGKRPCPTYQNSFRR